LFVAKNLRPAIVLPTINQDFENWFITQNGRGCVLRDLAKRKHSWFSLVFSRGVKLGAA
jgi:hypothetical protein